MEKLEENDELDIRETPEIIEQNEEIILKKTLEKINRDYTNDLLINELSDCYKSKNKLQSLEDRLIKKIYEKYSIKEKINENDPVDFVYTFNKSSNKPVFLLNLEIIRHNLPFIRNIIIITSMPQYFYEFYANDNKIFIIQINNIEKYKNMTNEFYHIYLIYFLKDLNYLSNFFFYSNSECIIAKPMKKSDISGIKINMSRKQINKDKNPAEYNTNIEFENKFGIYNELVSINQVNFIRKDVLIMMSRIFKIAKYPMDYLSLQYMIGYYFKIYDIELKNHNASGFYQYNIHYPYERFNITVNYFCTQYMNNKIIPYYVKSGLINLGIIRDNPISTIYVVGQKLKYNIIILEKILGKKVKFVFIEKNNKNRGKIGENIFLVDSSEKIEVDTIMLKISGENIEKIIPDILYFGNIYLPHKKEYDDGNKYKDKSNILEVVYPKIIIKNREYLIQLLGYGDSSSEVFGTVKRGFIEFANKK